MLQKLGKHLTCNLCDTRKLSTFRVLRVSSSVGVRNNSSSTSSNNNVDHNKKSFLGEPVFLSPEAQLNLREKLTDKVYHYMAIYEEFIGIKQVKEAHARVIQAEEKFIRSQELRRSAHSDLAVIQDKLRELRGELDRIPRGNDKYVELVTKEVNVMREERQCRSQFEELEKREREAFNELSSALRFSHEKERAQNEKTKYWSVLGSLVGAFVGIIGTTINSRLKLRQLQTVMKESTEQSIVQLEEKIAVIFKYIDEVSKLKLVPTPQTNGETLSPSTPTSTADDENSVALKLSSALTAISSQIDEFRSQLESIRTGQELLLQKYDPEVLRDYNSSRESSKTSNDGSDRGTTDIYAGYRKKTITTATLTSILFTSVLLAVIFSRQ